MKHCLTLLALTMSLLGATTAAAQSPDARATAGGTLHLDTRLSHGWIPIGEPAEMFATISIKGKPSVSTDRAPLNIALVIDRSTSMSGGKLAHAKAASHTLIDMLGSQDRLAIVSYGSDVTAHSASLLATQANKELLHNAVRDIRLSGSTNLAGGYDMGRQMVMKHNRDETINRVLLLSDGHANVGVSDEKQLGMLAARGLDRGVSLTTMGIGLDYNEEIMTRMAVEGAGNYYFIEDEKAIAAMFEKECKGLASTVARNTVLEIEMMPGVELLELHGFAHTTKGNRATVRLAEFFGNQEKDVLVKLVVSPQKGGATPIIKSTLRFDDVLQDDRRVRSETKLTAVATNETKKLEDVDRAVLERAQQLRTATAFNEAMDAYEKGESKRAARIVAEQRKSNTDFMTTYDFADDQAFGRVDSELEQLEDELKTTDSGSTEGKRLRKRQKARAHDISQVKSLF